jgi:translocation and assembly module TamB
LHADATMSPDQGQLDVKVTVPTLDVRLPHSTGGTLQQLAPAARIAVGTREPDGRFAVLPLHAPERPRHADATRVRAVVALGRDVRVRRDNSLDVELTGAPILEIGNHSHVSGTIQLTRGTVEVLGKRFTIEPASSLSFTGDVSDPQLVVTASYRTPDGTILYADVVGSAKKLEVNLRSDPPRSQDELLSLLLFGTEEGPSAPTSPEQQPDPAQRAAGLASGPLTQAVNRALSGITPVEVATRIDTSQAANPRPEVDVRISNEVLARITVQTGVPAPGEPPDRTLVTIDWHFRARWSLAATVGDQGSTFVDVLWHHRY